jgi:hypothetical protein
LNDIIIGSYCKKPGAIIFYRFEIVIFSLPPTFLSNSFKRSEIIFRWRISPSFKNGIIRLEAGAFKIFTLSAFYDVDATSAKKRRSVKRNLENVAFVFLTTTSVV